MPTCFLMSAKSTGLTSLLELVFSGDDILGILSDHINSYARHCCCLSDQKPGSAQFPDLLNFLCGKVITLMISFFPSGKVLCASLDRLI